jgi:hypothetical protein
MSRFLGKFPFVLLHLYAVARFIIGFENSSQLTAQKMGKPNTSVLHPPLHILNVGAPKRWTTVELMKVRDCAVSGQKKCPIPRGEFSLNNFSQNHHHFRVQLVLVKQRICQVSYRTTEWTYST